MNLAVRENILDHSKENGPKGLFSVSGVKFTTARLVAEKTIDLIFHKSNYKNIGGRTISNSIQFDFNWKPKKLDDLTKDFLIGLINSESVIHLDDLITRRTSIGDNPERALEMAPHICELFNWDNEQCQNEFNRLGKFYNSKRIKDINFISSSKSIQ